MNAPTIPAVMFHFTQDADGAFLLRDYAINGAGESVCSPVDAALDALARRLPIAVRAQDADAVRAAWVGERVTA